MSFDVERARRETPGCAEVVHFNNAGAALPPAVVTDTVVEYLRHEALVGGYEAAAAAAGRLDAVYASVARLLGAGRDDIALTDNATRSWQAVFYALPFGPGDRILTSRAEYASNAIAFLQVAGRTGAVVEVIGDDESGQLDVDELRRRVDGDVKLIAVSHVPTQGGLVNPAEEIGAVAEAAGIPFLLDACQSAGQLDLDVSRLKCDALSGTGRKYLRGPRGTGFLYVHPRLRERLEPAMLDLHSASWESPTEYVVDPTAKRFEVFGQVHVDRRPLAHGICPQKGRRGHRLVTDIRAQAGAAPHGRSPRRMSPPTSSTSASSSGCSSPIRRKAPALPGLQAPLCS